MSRNLPPLNVDGVSETTYDAADRLLRAFYGQDLREEHLLRGEWDAARASAAATRGAMGDVFRAEFPGRPRRRAERAGAAFADALFLQDEIENWAAVRSGTADAGPPSDLLSSDFSADYPDDVNADPRWEGVRKLLDGVCSDAGIDAAYAERQTAFWRAHGQRAPGWRRTAVDAHRLKVTAMVAGCPDDAVTTLSEYFVAGVELHDGWERADEAADFAEIRDVVAAYYQRVFDLRGGEPTFR